MNPSPRVLILLKPEDSALTKIRALSSEVTLGPWITSEDQCVSAEMVRDVEVLFCEVPPANFDDFRCLRWIQLTSAGYSQVLNLPILERKIRVTNGLGTFDVPIAEWNLMMMLWWHRSMLDAQANQWACVWDRAAKFQRELRGATVGFYGYGGIARETARLAKAMGLNVWALTRGQPARRSGTTFCLEGTGDPEGVLPDRVFAPTQIAEFMGGLDYLIVTVPLTPATRGIIGESQLRMLRPSAVLINCARAHIIDEKAYIQCLRDGWIRGSSLDVHYAYPLPPEHPLWRMPNVIMTPHVSGGSGAAHFLPRTYQLFTENLSRYVAGQHLLNELSTAQLEGK